MEQSNPIKPLQFKVISDDNGNKWVKEKVNPGTADNSGIRHKIKTGPKGGEYFTGGDGKDRYVSSVPTRVQVYPKDALPQAPPPGSVPFK